MRPLVGLLGLVILLAACSSGGTATLPTAAPNPSAAREAFVTARRAYADAWKAIGRRYGTALGPDLATHRAFWRDVATAADRYAVAVRAIDFPDKAKGNGAGLGDVLVTLRERAEAAAGAEDAATLKAREGEATATPLAEVVDLQNAVAGDLGLSLSLDS